MARLTFCDYHNMIAILEKYEHKVDFHQIVDFVEASHIMIETTNEGTKILATVDGKLKTISESSIRRNLKLNDEAGISSLPDAELFENLALMGYTILPNQKFTFQKRQFSHQWKYLIHTIMQCLSPKSTCFNEFSSNIATAMASPNWKPRKVKRLGTVANGKTPSFSAKIEYIINPPCGFPPSPAQQFGQTFPPAQPTGLMAPPSATVASSSTGPIESYHDAFNYPNWQNAMHDEYTALLKNKTWTLVPRPPDTNIVRCMWLFCHKYLADGKLSRYKARLVANGSTQLEGVDVDETFSPVVNPGTIRTILSLAVSQHRPIHQLDVKNAFLHGDLSETIYMHQPRGFQDSAHPDYVCLLQRQGTDIAYLLLYVDGIVLTASSESFLQQIIRLLHQEFAIQIWARLIIFWVYRLHVILQGCFYLRRNMLLKFLTGRIWIIVIPVGLLLILSLNWEVMVIRSLQHLTFTRPDISYAVQQVCLYMDDPREPHFSALKWILRYIRGILNFGLQLLSSSTTNLVVYSDADWAGCPTTRRSASGYCVFLGNNLLSWSSKRQPTLSRSSAEAEYRDVVNAVAETCWLHNLLLQHQRTKHIEIDIYFVRDLVAASQVRVLHVLSRYQFADIFTKGLHSALFEEYHTS
nr:ribonuclease H-like domain-containing protein [Tanacetum cinerariifolium]